MTTFEVAKKYVELCRAHQDHIALETLFSPDAVSIEAAPIPGMPLETKGRTAIAEKGKKWQENHEVHSAKVDGPWPNGNRFIVRFSYDVTNKPSGRRMQMDEAGLLTVENDKIVREEFFYSIEG
ncbi:MAG TPA: nuclear transport factor 2 family protein [Polyangiaceae bacterium]|nr:nuclear transport factor 2 family protein [Polyangiaceae bacterium]